MDVAKAIKERFSVRKYSDRKIEPEKLNAVLDAVIHAPTAVNYQPQKVYVMESEDALAKVKANSKFYFGSPAVLLVCYDAERAVKVPFMAEGNSGVMDATIVCDEMMLAAGSRASAPAGLWASTTRAWRRLLTCRRTSNRPCCSSSATRRTTACPSSFTTRHGRWRTW
ncbi:MAG: nitroreductase family protein [Fretibacterium sp.]|nr:nitroreductase family protein [Fretibacterium sp.]